ncbi:unnamed protein product [Leuciscus chuanchicus]
MEALQKIADVLEPKLGKISKAIEYSKKKIDVKNAEIQKCISSITSTTEEKAMQTPGVTPMMGSDAERRLKEQEWSIQNQLMDNQLKMAKLKIENGQMPSVIHLDEVHSCLSRIQQIRVQLQKFWEKVCSLLDMLKKRTFSGEIWIDDLADLKEEFL